MYHKSQEDSESSSSIFGGPALPALGHAVAGSTGSAISNVSTYPLALIVTRLQVQKQLQNAAGSGKSKESSSFAELARHTYEKEGINGLFVGVQSDTFKTIADSFLFFLVYNFLRQGRLRAYQDSKHLPIYDELSVGFVAGAFAKFITTPLANIVTRMQTQSMTNDAEQNADGQRLSARDVATKLYDERGLMGFWSGYSASLVLTLNPSLTFFLFNTLKRFTLRKQHRLQPSAQATFLIAAVSKAVASAITYPFSLAKTRLQVNGTSETGKDTGGMSNSLKHGPFHIFAVVSQIARREGLGSLYEGLTGELLKGFFNHGSTMLTKDIVHGLVIRLYYMVLKTLNRYPKPPDLVDVAKRRVKDALEATSRTAAIGSENSSRAG